MAKSVGSLKRVCIGAAGSVAVVKLPQIVQSLLDRGVYVDVILTDAAERLLRSRYNGQIPAEVLSELEALEDAAGRKRVEAPSASQGQAG